MGLDVLRAWSCAGLDPTEDQQATLRQILDGMLRGRIERGGRATVANGVNIAIGTK